MQNIDGPHMTSPALQDARQRQTPFPHFIASQSFAQDVADAAYTWLDANAPWRRHVSYFFDQFECNMLSMRLPRLLHEGLISPATLRLLRQRMEAQFSVSLADVFAVFAHRLVPGQGIGVHNDKPTPGNETHRLVVHLGPGFDDTSGGHLMFFRGKDPGDLACAFRSVHNTAVGFELSARSHHAVAELATGVRYTLVYSFWRADCADVVASPGERIEGDRLVPVGWTQAAPRDTHRAPHATSGKALDALLRVLVQAGAGRTPHPESAILPDLVHTYEILRGWRCSDAVCLAGLFHGVYGTARSPHRLIPLHQRDRVREAIGARAEELAYACCAASDETLQQALAHGDPGRVEDRWRGASLGIDRHTLAAIPTLIMAYRLAQHSRFPPTDEGWKDERRFFALASPHLDTRVRQAVRQVYDDGPRA